MTDLPTSRVAAGSIDTSRRSILRATAAAAALGMGASRLAAQDQSQGAARLDLHVILRATRTRVAIRPGAATRVWRYEGTLVSGDPGDFAVSAGGYLGPVFRVRRGQRVRIDLVNDLSEPTIIHWHGLHVPEAMDGHPRFAIAPGERYAYEFTVLNRAGTYWFHPHPHGRTGAQVYAGLAGLFLVSDDEEASLGLPNGAYDIPLVLQDRSFDRDNQFVYLGRTIDGSAAPSSHRGMMGGSMMSRSGAMGRGSGPEGGMGAMMAGLMGMLGDEILVNGQPEALLPVERRAYRLRLLNASNSRIYKLAWADGTPMTLIGTDGGLLAAPLAREYVMLAPAERLELWADFSAAAPGAQPVLQSLAFEGGMGGGMGMMGSAALPDGSAFAVLRFRVADHLNGTSAHGSAKKPPQHLSHIAPASPRSAVNADRPKVFDLTMRMMAWGINGKSFEMLAVSPLETVRLGTEELWEFRNDGMGGGMMGMAMPHSMHVHGLQFRVISRSTSGRSRRGYDTVEAGLVDEGWKDTVLVMPEERVRILVRFADFAGLFLYHCHMLEHEDAGLMRNYRVVA